jgi:hypothetical protein
MNLDITRPAAGLLHASMAVTAVICLTACETLPAHAPMAEAGSTASAPHPAEPELSHYFSLLDRLAASDATVEADLIQQLYLAARDTGSVAATLDYALALGSPYYTKSDPAEASNLLLGTLTGDSALSADQRSLAKVFQREYATRAELEENLSRQSSAIEHQQTSAETAALERMQALSAENERLTRERDELQKKLDAIAEIERSLIEREPEASTLPVPP